MDITRCISLLIITVIKIGESAPIADNGIYTNDEIIIRAARDVSNLDLYFGEDPFTHQPLMLVELDMLMNITEFEIYLKKPETRHKRKATSDDKKLWPGKKVYYEINRYDFYDFEIDYIRDAIREWEKMTCLTFHENEWHPSRIEFKDGPGCCSKVGYTGIKQPIYLSPLCRKKGIIVHEIGHSIGWYHEHMRPDRDNFIKINYLNIPWTWWKQYAKVNSSEVNSHGIEYDYDSVMHYGENSVDGELAITTVDPLAQSRIGQRIGLSFRDVKMANIMYKCSENCAPIKCPGEGFQGKDCKCYCPGPVGKPLRLCSSPEVSTSSPRPGCQNVRCPSNAKLTSDCLCQCPDGRCEPLSTNSSVPNETGTTKSSCAHVKCPLLGFKDANCACMCFDKDYNVKPCDELSPTTIATRTCSHVKCPLIGWPDAHCRCMCYDGDNNIKPCDELSPTTTTTTETPKTDSRGYKYGSETGKKCKDVWSKCQTVKVSGRCHSDRARMSIFCRKTCDLCNDDTSKMHVDIDHGCTRFAQAGYCTRAIVANYFRQDCPQACGVCKGSECKTSSHHTSGSVGRFTTVSAATIGFVLLFIKLISQQ